MPRVYLRASSGCLAVIDRAAAIRGASRTKFMLRSSEAAAVETLGVRLAMALDALAEIVPGGTAGSS